MSSWYTRRTNASSSREAPSCSTTEATSAAEFRADGGGRKGAPALAAAAAAASASAATATSRALAARATEGELACATRSSIAAKPRARVAGDREAHTAPRDPGGAPSSGVPNASARSATQINSRHVSGDDAVMDTEFDRSTSSNAFCPASRCSGSKGENKAPSAKKASLFSPSPISPAYPRTLRKAAAAHSGSATRPWKHPASASSARVALRLPALGTSSSATSASVVLVSASKTSRASRASRAHCSCSRAR
mmetsp:Transcript_5888/g.22277  ORF Transcript_5888/g.22277 Transcript_5888/m.22277 type:complete len:252 (-) Transcript_5888:1566-2321(-)